MKDFKQTEKTIKNYWINREKRANHALNHLKYVESKYKDQILYCINNSEIFDDSVPFFKGVKLNKQYFLNTDSISAAIKAQKEGKSVCILNFASYKHPGGGFLSGSSAQEEALCHESILFNILNSENLKSYYTYNNNNLNNGLYTNRAIYTENVLFIRNNKEYYFDVLTCAAPNVYTAQKYSGIDDESCFNVLKDRVTFISKILAQKSVNIAILGAFGCGVFGNYPLDLISIYEDIKWGKDLEYIVHAVPGNDENSRSFKGCFKEMI